MQLRSERVITPTKRIALINCAFTSSRLPSSANFEICGKIAVMIEIVTIDTVTTSQSRRMYMVCNQRQLQFHLARYEQQQMLRHLR